MHKKKWRGIVSVFFVSLALLSYEVGLTRYLSAVLLYHYAFLISSGAVLGLGLGSYFALTEKGYFKRIALTPWLFGMMFLATVLLFVGPYLAGLVPYAVLATMPSAVAGMWFGRLYRSSPESSGFFYSADLAGAGIAALTVLAVIDNFGLLSIFALAIFCAALAWLAYERISWKPVLASLFALGITGLALSGNLSIFELRAPAFTAGPASPTQKTGGEIIYSSWDSFARTDVIQGEDPNTMIVSIDGGAFSAMWRFDGDLESSDWGRENIGYLPFALGARDDVLIIGSGGGKDIVQALLGGHRNITAVEINRGSVEATRVFPEFSGSVYDLDNVQTVLGDGRSYARSTQQKYDIIYLAQVMAQSADLSGYALAENYIYTREAFGDYFKLLKEGGYLAFVAHDEGDMARIIATGMESLQAWGIKLEEVDKHMAIAYAIRPGHEAMPHLPVILISPEPFDEHVVSSFAAGAEEYGHRMYHLPGENSLISSMAMGIIDYREWLNSSSLNIRPVSDDSPFFYNFDRKLPQALIILMLASASMAAWFIYKGKPMQRGRLYWFTGLGLGFMLVETALIQKFILFLGHPARGFTVILAALLICAGLGSLAGRWFQERYGERVVTRIMLALPVVLIAQMFFLPPLFAQLAGVSSTAKVFATWLMAAPAGILLGIPFPQALTRLGRQGEAKLVPLAWAVNGAASLLGAVLAVVIAMSWGYSASLITGAVIYFVLTMKIK